MKTRILAMLCCLLMLFSLYACSTGDTGNQTDNNQILDPQKDPFTFLEAAGKKLKTAESFELEMWHHDEILSRYNEGKTTITLFEMQYMTELDGFPASYLTECSRPFNIWYYFHGGTGYSQDHYGKYNKHILEDSNSGKQQFWFLNKAIDIQNEKLFENFCALEPTVTTAEDGTVTITAYTTGEQLRTLLGGE